MGVTEPSFRASSRVNCLEINDINRLAQVANKGLVKVNVTLKSNNVTTDWLSYDLFITNGCHQEFYVSINRNSSELKEIKDDYST